MTEEPPSRQHTSYHTNKKSRSWIQNALRPFVKAEPQSKEDLMAIVKEAASNKVVDAEAVEIIEGALGVSNLQVREIMIPRSQMVVLKADDDSDSLLAKIIESGHSRFPVVGESIDEIKGVLLAKDLLPLILQHKTDWNVEDLLRPANIIPESKRLNVLLKEFREKRYHMALVIDEYGGISGLVTIEDILEEIVGDIEDETDDEEDEFIRKVSSQDFVVKALTPIEDFNEHFDATFSEEEFDTIGGILMQAFGRLPRRNDVVELMNYTFRILYADTRQIHLVRVTTPSE